MNGFELSEIYRMVANLLRVGVVSELDEDDGRVRVQTSGLTTDWLPWGERRAGQIRTWNMPTIGEQVLLASPFGDLGQAIIICSLHSEAHPAPASSKDKDTTSYPDGALQEYDSAASEYVLDVPAGGKITLRCGASRLELTDQGAKLIAPRIDLN